MHAPSPARARAFERFVARSLPYVPRGVVRRVARRYVAGETIDDVVRTVRQLAEEGATATVALLGEESSTLEQTSAAMAEYEQLLQRSVTDRLDFTISVKPTMVGLNIDEGLCEQNIARLAAVAWESGSGVEIDMEHHGTTAPTLAIYSRLRERWPNLGVALQAMLRRTFADIEELLRAPASVRLVKGIYREPPELALQERDEVRGAYSTALAALFAGGAYVAIATHDRALITDAEQRIKRLGLWHDQYEFQMLLGVLPDLRQELLQRGHPLRVYVPYGADWYAYSLRRLRENPEVARHVMRALLVPPRR